MVEIDVTLIGPHKERSTVTITEGTNVLDVTTSKYHLFWRSIKSLAAALHNLPRIIPFTAKAA